MPKSAPRAEHARLRMARIADVMPRLIELFIKPCVAAPGFSWRSLMSWAWCARGSEAMVVSSFTTLNGVRRMISAPLGWRGEGRIIGGPLGNLATAYPTLAIAVLIRVT